MDGGISKQQIDEFQEELTVLLRSLARQFAVQPLITSAIASGVLAAVISAELHDVYGDGMLQDVQKTCQDIADDMIQGGRSFVSRNGR